MARKRTLQMRISTTMILVLVATMICVGAVFLIAIQGISLTTKQFSERITKTSTDKSAYSMDELTQTRLRELAANKADLADNGFAEFKKDVETAAWEAEKIYENPDAYPRRSVPLPQMENDGELSIQALYLDLSYAEDPAVQEEVELLGNIQDLLIAINQHNPALASNYIALKTGFMIQADFISGKKFDENGDLMPFDASERPWYQGARDTGETFFTSVVKDAHTPQLAIMCGVPIFRDGEFMGVSGAGMYLDDLAHMVENINLGTGVNACILSSEGQVLFSTFKNGMLAAVGSMEDIRSMEDKEISAVARKAIQGEEGIELVEVDDRVCYVAYAPMKTVGWSFWIVLPQEIVEAPTTALTKDLAATSGEALEEMNRHVRYSAMMMVVTMVSAILIALLVSLILSRHIVMPIRLLTTKVQQIEGDNLDFHWDLQTRDETTTLAESFESLTERMKTYIADIQNISNEKERIATELSLATRIQAAMLPHVFPPFPERSEFDIYASMDPAKEVGGDFYDFFLIDEDHLGLIMADVSGKGVPAALFMMISKTIFQSIAMLGHGPREICTKANEGIFPNNPEGMFVTAWAGILEISTGKLVAVNAGHEYPVIMRAGGRFELMKDPHGCAIGVFDDVEYEEYTLELQPGDKIFLYTDGVPEACREDRKMLGTDRMVEILNEESEDDCRQVLEHMRRSVDAFVENAEQFDDITMMCLEYKGDAHA